MSAGNHSRPNPLFFVAVFLTLLLMTGTWNILFNSLNGTNQADIDDRPDSGTKITSPSIPDLDVETLPYEDQKAAKPPPPPPPAPKYTALLVETHPANVPNIVPIMMHFASVIGPDWPITFVTNWANYAAWEAPYAFRRAVDANQIIVKFLPPETSFQTHASVSTFLVGTWLWEQFQSYTRVLMFQVDSIVCANAPHRLEDFLEWDLVGAPILPGMGYGYNGGLSLRNPSMFLEIARDLAARVAQDPAAAGEVDYEDQWFYHKVKERGGKMPEADVAGQFSVETMYFEKPLGYHKVHYFQKEHQEDIDKYCPEVAMILKGSHVWRREEAQEEAQEAI